MSEIESLMADICRQCAEERFMSLIRFYPTVEYRQQQKYEERRQQYPAESPLKSLRMTIPGGLEDVSCDICETSCFDKHVNLRPLWLNHSDAVPLEAVVCEQCVATHLRPPLKFQTVAATASSKLGPTAQNRDRSTSETVY